MHKTYIPLILTIFLSACAGTAIAQSNDVMLTNTSEKVEITSTAEVVSKDPPTSCPVTVPQKPAFVPPAPYDMLGWDGYFWFGSGSLWTSLPQDGVWAGLPNNPDGYTQKIMWWRDGYVWDQEPEPNLTVTAERLDAKAPALIASKATNAYARDMGSAMLVGVDFPTLGCWKITGKYADTELSFVVWVAP